MNPIPGPMPKTPEWESLRFFDPQRSFPGPVVFGASEAAAICGFSPYETPRHVYHQKRRELPPKEVTPAMIRGLRCEPLVIEEYKDARPDCLVVAPQPMYFHPLHTCLAATPDAMVSHADEAVGWPFDAKWIGRRRADEFGESGGDGVPDEIIFQAQQQMLVMGADKQETGVVLCGDEFRIYTIHKNVVIQEAILDAAIELAERIKDGRPPEPTWTHPRMLDLVKALYDVEQKQVPLSDETALLWANYQRLKEEIREREAEADALQARVLDAMGSATIGVLPHGSRCLIRKRITVPARTQHVKEFTYVRLWEGEAKKWAK
jgi:predicted phage-related endonuclease